MTNTVVVEINEASVETREEDTTMDLGVRVTTVSCCEVDSVSEGVRVELAAAVLDEMVVVESTVVLVGIVGVDVTDSLIGMVYPAAM